MTTDEMIRRAANVILKANHLRMGDFPDLAPISVQASRQYARALAEAGLLTDGHIVLHMDEPPPRAIPVTMPCRRCGWWP